MAQGLRAEPRLSGTDSAFLAQWQATTSGDAKLGLKSVIAGKLPVLQMHFDFKDGGGFAVAKRTLSRVMPEDYVVRFRLRGRGAIINLELKLVDGGGRNVWRHVQKDLQLPARWRTVTVESKDIDFGWGPAGGGSISQLGSIELAIVASAACSGTLWIGNLQIEDVGPSQTPAAYASSELPQFGAAAALNGSGWKPRPEDLRPWLAIDSHQALWIGGVIIDWLDAAPASGFRIRGSMSGRRWNTLYVADHASGKRSYVYLPNTRLRFLRLDLDEPCVGASLRMQSFEFSRSIDAFWQRIAAAEVRGWNPRWLHREQTLWTPIGTSNGTECALMNDDGMVEVAEGSFSIEPMLRVDGRLVTWSDVTLRQELLHGWMPVPTVIWESAGWRLRVKAETTVSGVLRVCYRMDNLTDAPLSARLFVLLRPFQVTPPWQSFRGLGGVSLIHDLAWCDGVFHVNGSPRIVPSSEPAQVRAASFDEGRVASYLAAGSLPPRTEVHDAFGFATGVLDFDLAIPAHGNIERVMTCVKAGAAAAKEPVFDWGRRIPMSQWSGNGWITEAVHAALTATAHILVTRSGSALQPGPRRYTRSWIRDGAMMSAALLRMGHTAEVGEYIRWYAPHQRADGFVPCCVDAEGVDWLVEHDSHGQLIALIADHFRFTADREFLRQCWVFLDKAATCIEALLDPTGLMPISVSHEGYLAQPVHSYWDDFWTLRGLKDAAHVARALGHEASAQHRERLAARFATSLYPSIEATRARRDLNFIPGSVEWADFDPTATANALYLFDVPDQLNRAALERTFTAYLTEWRAKRSGAVDSPSYTPYEIRIIGAFVRLGWRAAALELLKFFLSDRRPQGWNQWPEIAWRDRKAPAHVGDLPHTWIAAEYVLALRSLFAYEQEAQGSLIVAAGLAPEWIEGAGVRVHEMPTLNGRLSYSIAKVDADTLHIAVHGGIVGKVVLRPPLSAPLRTVLVDGRPYDNFDGDSVTLLQTPADVTCST